MGPWSHGARGGPSPTIRAMRIPLIVVAIAMATLALAPVVAGAAYDGSAATIAEETGRMSASTVADEFTFALLGACTTP